MKRLLGCMLILACVLSATAETIPDFTLPGIGGEPFRMGQRIGEKIYVIDFWATWCQPCKALLKRLQQIKDRDSEVEVLAISIDDASAQAMAVNYVQGKRFNFILLFDAEGRVAKMLNPAMQIPFTLIVDRGGRIVYSHAGYVPGIEKELLARIQACR
jgi:peroxiredoxin